MDQLARGRARDALPFISAALEAHRRNDWTGQERASYLSYQGLCRCLTRSDMHAGLRECRRAAELDPWDPDIWWNLGRVSLMAGRRSHAHQAFMEGLGLQPDHAGISRELRRMGVRRRPALRFLERSHPLNVWMGRFASLFRQPASCSSPGG
jgi:Flp pilus assembly protein TadD